MWGALLSLIPAALQYFGQQDTNKSNERLAANATQANMNEAERNRQFQAQMSNTAHQREAEDLAKAGLNPMLSANAGASSPSGSTGSAVAAKLDNPMGGLSGILNSALDAYKTLGEIDLQGSQAALMKAQTKSLGQKEVEGEVYRDAYKMAKGVGNKIGGWLNSSAKELERAEPKKDLPAVTWDPETKSFKKRPGFSFGPTKAMP